jgi:hypothetical protein
LREKKIKQNWGYDMNKINILFLNRSYNVFHAIDL